MPNETSSKDHMYDIEVKEGQLLARKLKQVRSGAIIMSENVTSNSAYFRVLAAPNDATLTNRHAVCNIHTGVTVILPDGTVVWIMDEEEVLGWVGKGSALDMELVANYTEITRLSER